MRKRKPKPSGWENFMALLYLMILAIPVTMLGRLLQWTGISVGPSFVIAFIVLFVGGILGVTYVTKRFATLKIQKITEQHLAPLVRRRAQLVRRDGYSKLYLDDWEKEVNYFVSRNVEPSLTQFERWILEKSSFNIRKLIFERVEAAIRANPATQAFSLDMNAIEFETFCAEELRTVGWDARVTMRSRDQGVDVVAEKNGVRAAVQCKLYSQPVGNKSVQEAAAGRAHEHADYAIVVTNNSYTSAAEQLAATNGVLLLHFTDLRNLEDLLREKRAK